MSDLQPGAQVEICLNVPANAWVVGEVLSRQMVGDAETITALCSDGATRTVTTLGLDTGLLRVLADGPWTADDVSAYVEAP